MPFKYIIKKTLENIIEIATRNEHLTQKIKYMYKCF